MREILFRGKWKDNGEWKEGGYYREDYTDNVYITFWNSFGLGFMDSCQVERSTVGQYTGLEDKNGKRIFEGDIVRSVSQMNDYGQKGATDILLVRFFMGNMCLCFPGCTTGTPIFPACVGATIEVIGNIHDNPELMEG